MKKPSLLLLSTLCLCQAALAQTPPATGELLDFKSLDAAALKTENEATVSMADEAGDRVVAIAYPASKGYPGVDFPPQESAWDLSAFGSISADVTNKNSVKVGISMRVENKGDWRQSPWNTQVVWLDAGATGTVTVNFGESFGKPGFALDAARVSNVKIFVNTPKEAGEVIVHNLKASGTPGERPAAAAPKPAGGAAAPVATENLNAPNISGEIFAVTPQADLTKLKTEGSTISLAETGEAPALSFTGKPGSYPNVKFPCPQGGWNLSPFAGIQVELTNTGTASVRAALRADNPGDWKAQPWNTEMTTLKAGETKTVQLVFGQENGAPAFPLDPQRISGIQIFLEHPKQPASLIVRNLRAYGTDAARAQEGALSSPADRDKPVTIPDWVGSRPPVEGDWVQTLNENFDDAKINELLWTPRLCWDGPAAGELQRYSEGNVSVSDGSMKIKCEKLAGHQYDNPNLATREYTTGAITTFGKWTQLYGYFEARIKLPTARGLWPAFWTMPDRGEATGLDIWKRRDTGISNGKGMEMDIFEHLTEWGPGRYNIATHWDGYGAEHKQRGSSHTYYGPTADGWHVAGFLWEPGKLTWYLDGVKKGEWSDDRICDVPSYLKFTVQMGSWATKDVDISKLPDLFEVDYVRAWQLKSRVASPATAAN